MTLSPILAVCDPEYEMCSPDDELVRPSFWNLFWMIWVYGTNINVWGIYFTVFLAYIATNFAGISYSDLSSLASHFVMMTVFTAWSAIVFSPASWVLFIYLIFGSNFFLFKWTDNLGMWFVTKFVPGASLYYKLTVMLYWIWNWNGQRGSSDGGGLEKTMLMWFAFTALPLEYAQWSLGVKTARRMDPSWNEQQGKLYPPILYSLGIVKESSMEPESDNLLMITV